MWGTLQDIIPLELDLSPLERMKVLENLFAEIGKPRTMLLARELLGVCVTILPMPMRTPKAPLRKDQCSKFCAMSSTHSTGAKPKWRSAPPHLA